MNLSVAMAGTLTGVTFAATIIGQLSGGYFSDRWAEKTSRRPSPSGRCVVSPRRTSYLVDTRNVTAASSFDVFRYHANWSRFCRTQYLRNNHRFRGVTKPRQCSRLSLAVNIHRWRPLAYHHGRTDSSVWLRHRPGEPRDCKWLRRHSRTRAVSVPAGSACQANRRGVDLAKERLFAVCSRCERQGPTSPQIPAAAIYRRQATPMLKVARC
jgi:hypothetical protein